MGAWEMRRRAAVTCCVLSALSGTSASGRLPAPAGADVTFDEIGRRYIDALPRFAPEYGTTLGDHRHDGDLSDPSAAGRGCQIAFERGLLAEIARLDRAKLTRDEQVDAALLENQFRQDIWTMETLQRWAWDPHRRSVRERREPPTAPTRIEVRRSPERKRHLAAAGERAAARSRPQDEGHRRVRATSPT